MYGPPPWWQVVGEDPCWRQIALVSGIVICLSAWHPAICRYSRSLCVPTSQLTALMLGWVALGGKSLPKSIHAQGGIPTPAGLVSTLPD